MNLISNERSFLDYLDKATAEMRNLNEEIKDCRVCRPCLPTGRQAGFACHLRSPSVEPLCGAGYPLADIFLLKSFPDEEEKDKKVAFAGRIGEVFYKAFERLNIDVSTVYGTNVLKCQPANEDLTDKEISQCIKFLKLEIAIVKPRVILSMGELATSALNLLSLKFDEKLSFSPGGVCRLKPDMDAIITHNPEQALGCENLKKELWRDLQLLKKYLPN